MSHPTGTVGGVIALGTFFGILVVQLPVFVVLVVGFVLLSSQGRGLPPRTLLLARAGLGVLLAEALVSITWSTVLPQIFTRLDYSSGLVRTYGLATAIVSFMLALLFALGLGLLIAAVLAARAPGFTPPPPDH
jgi:hypothetical protein